MSYILLEWDGCSSEKEQLEAYALANLVPLHKLKLCSNGFGLNSSNVPSKMTRDDLICAIAFYYFNKSVIAIKTANEIQDDSNLVKHYGNRYLGSASNKIDKNILISIADVYSNFIQAYIKDCAYLKMHNDYLFKKLTKAGLNKDELTIIENKIISALMPLNNEIDNKLMLYKKNKLDELPLIFKRIF